MNYRGAIFPSSARRGMAPDCNFAHSLKDATVMNLVKPAALRRGHTIGIVAPASNIKQDLLDQGCRELESLGFKTRYRPDITTSYRYFSGTRERRLAEFLEMLRNPDIRAIFCARGGYGSGQLIPDIDAELIRQN